METRRAVDRPAARRVAVVAAAAAVALGACGDRPAETSAESDPSSQTCVDWVHHEDDDARSEASSLVVDATVEGTNGERAMFGARATVWEVTVLAVDKGDIGVGETLDVASTPLTCSGETYPDGDPLDVDGVVRLYLDDGDFAVPGTESGWALITPYDGVGEPLAADGDAATWELVDRAEVTAQTDVLDIAVTRLGCASGVTGDVLEPQVTYEDERVVVQADVAPLGDLGADCQGNDAVPVRVELDEPVGDRELVDGACLAGEAATTAPCHETVRWTPPS